jgi:hypothetical protein
MSWVCLCYDKLSSPGHLLEVCRSDCSSSIGLMPTGAGLLCGATQNMCMKGVHHWLADSTTALVLLVRSGPFAAIACAGGVPGGCCAQVTLSQ